MGQSVGGLYRVKMLMHRKFWAVRYYYLTI